MEKEGTQTGQEAVEEYKSTADSGQDRMDQQGDQIDGSVEETLVKHMDNLFELENIKRHYYLMSRLNTNFEIDFYVILNERSIQGITSDPAIVEAALSRCKFTEYTKGGPVRLQYRAERRTLWVKGIKKSSETEFSNLIQQISNTNQKIKEVDAKYDEKTRCILLTSSSESMAIELFTELQKKTFEGQSIDCMIKDESPYIDLLESIKASKKNFNSGYNNRFNNYYQPQPMMMNPYGYYPMPAYNFPPQYHPEFVKPTPYIRKNRENYRENGYDGYERNSNGYYGGRDSNRNNYSNVSTGTGSPIRNTEENQEYSRGDNYYRGGYKPRRYYENGGGDYKQRRNYYDQREDKKRMTPKELEAITSVNSGDYPPLV